MKSVALGFLVVCSVSLTGCPTFVKAPGPAYSPATVPAGKAVIYFYRPAEKIMSDYPFFMSLPESANNCFRLESGGYAAFVTDPGKITVAGMMTKYQTLTYDVKAGEERYIEIAIVDDEAAPREVQAAEGKSKISQTQGIETCSPDELKKE